MASRAGLPSSIAGRKLRYLTVICDQVMLMRNWEEAELFEFDFVKLFRFLSFKVILYTA